MRGRRDRGRLERGAWAASRRRRDELRHAVGAEAAQHVRAADGLAAPVELHAGDLAALGQDGARLQIGAHLARVGLEAIEEQAAQPLPAAVEAEGAAAVQIAEARHARRRRRRRRRRRSIAGSVNAARSGWPSGSAASRSSSGAGSRAATRLASRRSQKPSGGRIRSCDRIASIAADTSAARADTVSNAARRVGHLARELARQIVADVDAMVGQEQLVGRAIGLEPPPQELHQVQLADDALERRRSRCRRTPAARAAASRGRWCSAPRRGRRP